jgi:DNA-binding transcriptional MerR regulator
LADPSQALTIAAQRLPIRLTIGQVCRQTGLRPGTLRNWEERYRLLVPARTAGGTRLYSQEDVKRIREIQSLLRLNGNSLLGVARSLERRRAEAKRPDATTASTLERLLQLASRAEVAIENARLLEKANLELSQAAEFEKQLHNLATVLGQERSLDRVAEVAVSAAAGIFSCDSALICLATNGGVIRVRAVWGDRYLSLRGQAVERGAHPELDQVLDCGRVMVVNDLRRSEYCDTPLAWEFQPEAFLLAPIVIAGRRLGALLLAHTLLGQAFSAAAPARAEILTAKIASALVNAEAFAEVNQMRSSILAALRHQLRTPLNSLIGFSDLMEKGTAGELTPKQKHYVANIRQSGAQLVELIDRILEDSEPQSTAWSEGKPRRVDPSMREEERAA